MTFGLPLALFSILPSLWAVPSPAVSGPHPPKIAARKQPLCAPMTSTQLLAQRLTCLFETGQSQISAQSVENLGDGRGYTCGWAGFTTADEEVVACVEAYTRLNPNNELALLLPELRRLQSEGSDDVSVLDEGNFEELWKTAAQTPEFQSAYAEVVDAIFGAPASARAAELRLKTPIGYAIVFDSIIQHGNGDDPDALPAMIERTRAQNGEPATDETAWLQAFLEVRRQTLQNPDNRKTAKEWRKSVPRVDALEFILNQNPNLQTPIQVQSRDYDETIE